MKLAVVPEVSEVQERNMLEVAGAVLSRMIWFVCGFGFAIILSAASRHDD